MLFLPSCIELITLDIVYYGEQTLIIVWDRYATCPFMSGALLLVDSVTKSLFYRFDSRIGEVVRQGGQGGHDPDVRHGR